MSMLLASVSPAERRRARQFAQLLEESRPATGHELESLVALAATLRPAPLTPRAEFRTALRESLVAECAARQPVAAKGRTQSLNRTAPPETPRHRLRTAVATGVLASLVGGVGAAAASTHALPGDSLYGLKRGLESAQLQLSHSDLSRGRELLKQADHRLSEAEALAASENARSPETTRRIATALADLDRVTRAGADALDAAYVKTGDAEPMLELDRFTADQRMRLDDLASLLNPTLQARVTALTDLLGTLQTRAASLTQGESAAAVSGATGSDPAAPRGDRAGGETSSLAPALDASPGKDHGSGSDPLAQVGSAVAGTVGGLTGHGTSSGGGSAASPGTGGSGGAATATTLPTAIPQVSALPTPLPVRLPAPVHPSSSPQVSLPTASLPALPVTPPCVAVPPLTTC